MSTRSSQRRTPSRRTPPRRTPPRRNSSDSSVYSSFDEQTFGAEEDQPLEIPDTVTVSSASSSATSATASGLPLNIRKSLAIDISARGGLGRCKLWELCNEKNKTKLYGSPRSKRRKQVSNQIQRWKNDQRHEFDGLVTGQFDTNLPLFQSPQESTSTLVQSSSAPRLGGSAQLTSPLQPRSPPAVLRSTAPHLPAPSPRPFNPKPSVMASQTFLSSILRHENLMPTIAVDTSRPERNNFPFLINYFTDHIFNDKTLHNGFELRLKNQDLRFMNLPEEAFGAWYDGHAKVVVKSPSMGFDYLYNAKGEDAGMKAAEYKDPRILEAYNVTRNDIVNDTDRHYVYWVLDFTNVIPHPLDNDIFSPNAENGKLVVDVHPIVSGFSTDHTGKRVANSFAADVVWNIAIVEPHPRYVTAAEPKTNPLTSKLTKSMGGLAVYDAPLSSPESIEEDPMDNDDELAGLAGLASLGKEARTSADERRQQLRLRNTGDDSDDSEQTGPRVSSLQAAAASKRSAKAISKEGEMDGELNLKSFTDEQIKAIYKVVGTAPDGTPVKQYELEQMVQLYADRNGVGLDQAQLTLNQETNPQEFIKAFWGIFQDKALAWKEPEQEIGFSAGVEATEGTTGKTDCTEDDDPFKDV